MKSIIKLFFIASIAITLGACNNNHLISDKTKRNEVQTDFNCRRSNLNADNLYSIFNKQLTTTEREALTFLYAYMPLGDIACYDGEFFLKNIQTSLQARAEMPWGKTIPDREFRHFVLPVRVNNENLDSSRWVFYNELKPRIEHLSLYDAVLEVNHWCHEYVTYTPSDSRTSSPLASIKTAYARCGEESTFLVAALRSVGIPARQVYTPRWAHTDDNHAWVEAWVDGKWYFLGACEPEPVLNLGWFNAPASRGMLMHTKVFGKYDGPEEVMQRTPLFTEINVIDNYAPCSRAEVIINGTEGNTIEGATVEFKLYNYAEFYTVARKTTDRNGRTFLTAGNGDMLVWATHNGKFGYSKLSFGKDTTINIILNRTPGETYTEQLDIIPPREWANLPEVTEEQRAENNRRFAYEDSIRNAYIATMYDETKAREYVESIQLTNENNESADIIRLLVASRGNHATILKFFEQNGGYNLSDKIQFLNELSAKDLRDITTEVINDHYMTNEAMLSPVGSVNSVRKNNSVRELISRYIRNPRVANEMLTPYRSFFRNQCRDTACCVLTSEASTCNINQLPYTKEAYQNNPMLLVDWVRKNIKIDPQCNLGGAPIQPMGVWHARIADALSRNIFFVALARSLDIPARIDEVTGKVQLIDPIGFSENELVTTDINFESDEQTITPQGKLIATFQPTKTQSDPKYYYHFTISKINYDGTLQLLNYDEGESGMEQGAAWSNLLKNGTNLDCGNYLMVTGSRLANGGVLAEMNFFTIKPEETTTTELVMRQSTDQVQVIGSFNSESLYTKCEIQDNSQLSIRNSQLSILSTTGRGYYVIGIIGNGDEPTNHALRDIISVTDQLNEWGRSVILLSPNADAAQKTFTNDLLSTLNSQLTTLSCGIDINGSIQSQIAQEMKLKNSEILPIFIIADTFNRVVFCSQGYTIGLGEQLIKTIHQLEN
ncbi:MAG: transglutaminase domain-containing protein [Paludibacteraceae bacterium]|nr:transglutaminase domain-containing protein [Paludibacteraceae bacterium]